MAFAYRGGALCAEQVPLDDIARRFGTPCYVYSRGAIEAAYRAFADELAGRPSLICYSVKANSNLSLLALMAKLGAGFDIVSGGELERVLAAGGDPGRVVFSGVGKSEAEIRRAARSRPACFRSMSSRSRSWRA
jgi:diaminopimelate decarboxylase